MKGNNKNLLDKFLDINRTQLFHAGIRLFQFRRSQNIYPVISITVLFVWAYCTFWGYLDFTAVTTSKSVYFPQF